MNERSRLRLEEAVGRTVFLQSESYPLSLVPLSTGPALADRSRTPQLSHAELRIFDWKADIIEALDVASCSAGSSSQYGAEW